MRRPRCTRGSGRAISVEACPRQVIKNHVEFIKRSQMQDGSGIDQRMVPLLPTMAGGRASRTIGWAGWRERASGREVGGHTPRGTGTKRMLKEDGPTQAIQQLGRVASPTVLAYVGETYAEKSAGRRSWSTTAWRSVLVSKTGW